MRLFTGYDPCESGGWHVFTQSLIDTGGEVGAVALTGKQGDGSNAFTYSRFDIPRICNWAGWAIFVDGNDMLLKSSIEELWSLRNSAYAVMVVKHDYKTKHPRKYVGSSMECENKDYPRKNWSSVILWNCGHRSNFNARLMLSSQDGSLHRFPWLEEEEIGELPKEWNWLCDEYGENPKAKLLHWTCGVPGFNNYKNAPHAAEWLATRERMVRCS